MSQKEKEILGQNCPEGFDAYAYHERHVLATDAQGIKDTGDQFEAHLEKGCEVCRQQLEAYRSHRRK